MMSARARLRERAYHLTKYPRGWRRASRIIQRLACGVCQKCGEPSDFLEVHHIGAPFASGRPGDRHDKHDIRQENLMAICTTCHDELEQVRAIRKTRREKKKRRATKRMAHRALGVGTGLVPYTGTERTLLEKGMRS